MKEVEKKAKVKKLNELAAQYNTLLSEVGEIGEDDRVPCVRINGAGQVEFYNCKTGEVIKS